MKKRYGDAKLPDSVIVDMREETMRGNTGVLSEALAQEPENGRLRKNLEFYEAAAAKM